MLNFDLIKKEKDSARMQLWPDDIQDSLLL